MSLSITKSDHIIWNQHMHGAFADCVVSSLNWDNVPEIGQEVLIHGCVYTYHQNDLLIGFGYFSGDEVSFCVNANCRGDGNGHRIFRHLLDIARSNGINPVYAVVRGDNAYADRILKLLGAYTKDLFVFEGQNWSVDQCIEFLTKHQKQSITAKILL